MDEIWAVDAHSEHDKEIIPLFDGITTLVLAILIWRGCPSSTEWVIGTLVRPNMLFSGVAR